MPSWPSAETDENDGDFNGSDTEGKLDYVDLDTDD